MKKLSALLSIVVVALGIGACAMESGTATDGDVGRVQQAICKGGLPCQPPPGGGGASSSGDVLADPTPPAPPPWQCPVKGKDEPCGFYLKKVGIDEYQCVHSCPGGPFVIHYPHPCGVYQGYYCNAAGTCYCR
jgi:hypothetical protein